MVSKQKKKVSANPKVVAQDTQWSGLIEDDPDAARAREVQKRAADLAAEKSSKHVAWKSKDGAKKKVKKAEKLQPLAVLAKEFQHKHVKEWLEQAATVEALGDDAMGLTLRAALEDFFFGCDCKWLGGTAAGAPLSLVKEPRKVTQQSLAMLTKALRKIDQQTLAHIQTDCAHSLMAAMATYRSDVVASSGSALTGSALMLQLSLVALPTTLTAEALYAVARRGGAAGKWQPCGLQMVLYQLACVQSAAVEHGCMLWAEMLSLTLNKASVQDANAVLKCVGSYGASLHSKASGTAKISALRIVHQLWMIELPKKCTEARRAATAQLLDTAALGSEAAVVAAVCAADVQWAVALGDLQQADFTTAVVAQLLEVDLVGKLQPTAFSIWTQMLEQQIDDSPDADLMAKALENIQISKKSRDQRNLLFGFFIMVLLAAAVAFGMTMFNTVELEGFERSK